MRRNQQYLTTHCNKQQQHGGKAQFGGQRS